MAACTSGTALHMTRLPTAAASGGTRDFRQAAARAAGRARPPTCMKGDMVMYVCGACHSVRSSAWKPKGVSVRL